MCKEITIKEAVAHVKDGDTIMVGGFMTNGTPEKLIDALVEKGVKDLTLICNDAGFPDKGVGKMVANKQFSTIFCDSICSCLRSRCDDCPRFHILLRSHFEYSR